MCMARLPRVQSRLIRRRPRLGGPGRAVALLGRLAPPRAVQLLLLGPGAQQQGFLRVWPAPCRKCTCVGQQRAWRGCVTGVTQALLTCRFKRPRVDLCCLCREWLAAKSMLHTVNMSIKVYVCEHQGRCPENMPECSAAERQARMHNERDSSWTTAGQLPGRTGSSSPVPRCPRRRSGRAGLERECPSSLQICNSAY